MSAIVQKTGSLNSPSKHCSHWHSRHYEVAEAVDVDEDVEDRRAQAYASMPASCIVN